MLEKGQTWTRGEGVKKSEIFMDVIDGCPLGCLLARSLVRSSIALFFRYNAERSDGFSEVVESNQYSVIMRSLH